MVLGKCIMCTCKNPFFQAGKILKNINISFYLHHMYNNARHERCYTYYFVTVWIRMDMTIRREVHFINIITIYLTNMHILLDKIYDITFIR